MDARKSPAASLFDSPSTSCPPKNKALPSQELWRAGAGGRGQGASPSAPRGLLTALGFAPSALANSRLSSAAAWVHGGCTSAVTFWGCLWLMAHPLSQPWQTLRNSKDKLKMRHWKAKQDYRQCCWHGCSPGTSLYRAHEKFMSECMQACV